MLYDLVFHLNLDLEIFNQLCMVIIITLFHLLKVSSPLLLMKLYTSSLEKSLIRGSTILYGLVFHLNLDLEIFNQLGMVIIITLFHLLKVSSPLLLMKLYTSSLEKSLVRGFIIFFFDSQWK